MKMIEQIRQDLSNMIHMIFGQKVKVRGYYIEEIGNEKTLVIKMNQDEGRKIRMNHRLKYLSPTSLKIYENDPEQFYLQYLAKDRIPRMAQLQVMSIGSAVDARIKAFLAPDKFDLEKLFNDQVEEHNREWAWENSERVFEEYKALGGLTDLMMDIQKSIIEPVYEFDVIGELVGGSQEGVPIFGKPDMFYVTEDGTKVIVDYKVNGYCSSYGVSPVKGYVKARGRARDGSIEVKEYPDATLIKESGLVINVGAPMDTVAPEWAAQGCTYAWMLGVQDDENFIMQIEQFACRPTGIRCVTHRSKVSKEFQEELKNRYRRCWEHTYSWYDERLEEMATRISTDPRERQLWETI